MLVSFKKRVAFCRFSIDSFLLLCSGALT
jgi:hypothetical protein